MTNGVTKASLCWCLKQRLHLERLKLGIRLFCTFVQRVNDTHTRTQSPSTSSGTTGYLWLRRRHWTARWLRPSSWSARSGCKLCCKASATHSRWWAASRRRPPSGPVGCPGSDRVPPPGTPRQNSSRSPMTPWASGSGQSSAPARWGWSEHTELRREDDEEEKRVIAVKLIFFQLRYQVVGNYILNLGGWTGSLDVQIWD